MAAVLLGLACAFFIGTANFMGGLVSKRDASLTIAFVGQLTTVPVMVVVLLCVPASSVAVSDVAWGVASGVVQITGLRLIWQAMSAGKMGLLAAINALMGAIVPAVWAITRGEAFGVAAVCGAALAVVALVLIVRSPGEEALVLQHRRQALMAALAGTCFGLGFIALAYPAKSASVVPLLASRTTGAALGALMIAFAGGRFWISRNNTLGLLPGMFGVA